MKLDWSYGPERSLPMQHQGARVRLLCAHCGFENDSVDLLPVKDGVLSIPDEMLACGQCGQSLVEAR